MQYTTKKRAMHNSVSVCVLSYYIHPCTHHSYCHNSHAMSITMLFYIFPAHNVHINQFLREELTLRFFNKKSTTKWENVMCIHYNTHVLNTHYPLVLERTSTQSLDTKCIIHVDECVGVFQTHPHLSLNNK